MAVTRITGLRLGRPVNARTLRDKDGVTGKELFRCDRCRRLFLGDFLIWQDGLRLCSVYCRTLTSGSELDKLWAEQQAVPDSFEPVLYPPLRAMSDSVIITAIDTDFPIYKKTTDGSFNVVLTGIGITSADAPTATLMVSPFTETDLTGTTVFTTTTATVTIDPSALSPGDYNIDYAGTRYFRALRIS